MVAEPVPGYDRPPPGRKTTRTMPRKPSPLADAPILISEFKKNRGNKVIRIALRNYLGHDLLDIRTWWNDHDGQCKPGRGFSCNVSYLPQIIKALNAALLKARELGLIDDGRT
jgi:Transcriptional Coactivator p15 (PC4)